MLKKKISIISVVLLLLLSTTAFAGPYQNYLNDDPNLPLCDGHMGTAWYVDLSSAVVNLYNPPHYIIGVNVITVDADAGYVVKGTKAYQFKYNYNTQQMYVMDSTGNWQYIRHNGSWAECGVVEPAGKIAFQQAYNTPFYH